MSNPFKELDELEEDIKAPSSVKQEVMGSYGLITGFARVVEFIVTSLTDVCKSMLRLFDEPKPSTQKDGTSSEEDNIEIN